MVEERAIGATERGALHQVLCMAYILHQERCTPKVPPSAAHCIRYCACTHMCTSSSGTAESASRYADAGRWRARTLHADMCMPTTDCRIWMDGGHAYAQRYEQMPMRACPCTCVLMFMLVKVRRIAAGATHASDNRGHTVAGHGRPGRAPAPHLPTRTHMHPGR